MAVRTHHTMHTIGQAVVLHRKAAGLTRIALADLAGVGKTALFDIEHGKPGVRFSTLKRVLDALNITLRLESPLMAQMGPQLQERDDDA